jgi:hypothetical protein
MSNSVIGLVAIATLLCSGPLRAQASGSPQGVRHGAARVPLIIALVPVLPHPGVPFEIVRRTTGPVPDVVLLTNSATVEQLTDAIRGVLTARYVAGDTAAQNMVVRTRPGASVDLRPVFPWAHRVLTDLQRAPVRGLDGIGAARSVRIWLPAQHARGRRPR